MGGDLFVGVFGNRYATDVLEAEVKTTDPLHLLTGVGMIGTVQSRHREVGPPTQVIFMGYLVDSSGERVSLIREHFHPDPHPIRPPTVVLVVGTGMNAGKTTTAAKLVRALLERRYAVAAVKLTGSVSNRDRNEFVATGATHVADFSDHGFPSTYLAAPKDLVALTLRLLSDATRAGAEVVVAEVADGVLQLETALLLADPTLHDWIDGVVVAASCAPSALYAIGRLEQLGHRAVAVSGRVTNAPLFMREIAQHTSVPVVASINSGHALADLVLNRLMPVG